MSIQFPRVIYYSLVVALIAGSAATASAKADKKETTKKTWTVDAPHGTYSDAIPIEVPAFRGITPERSSR